MSPDKIIIRRCTRDGRILWHHVAAQMGVSEATARAQHDSAYLKSYAPTPAPPKAGTVRARLVETDLVDAALLRALAGGPQASGTLRVLAGVAKSTATVRLANLAKEGRIVRLPGRQGWALAQTVQ